MPICVHVEQETIETTRVRFAHRTESVLRVGRDELTGAVMLTSPTHLSHDLTIDAVAEYPLQVKLMVPCSGRRCCKALLWPFRVRVAVEHCVLLNSVVHCVLAVSVGRLVNEHMLIQVSTWLLVDINTRSHKVLCYSGVDGCMPASLSATSMRPRSLCRPRPTKVGDLRAVDGIKFRGLCLALPITPRLQPGGRRAHAFTRHEDASWNMLNDLSEEG